ncbi:MAG: protein kinase [Acidobacteriota bacterium]|nr:protein kinase [Acidobacteriota bacterium]
MIGSTLGHYRIEGQLGAGGMGVVYLARDSVLRREVALKVLPDAFASDPERLARFEREAQLLASLTHPNIAAIHGMEQADAVRYLVLELVPGETLAERLTGGPLPVDEALEVCRQIAEALDAAHEKGIIHRDLKPANVKITPAGKVKVLDFGLAKAFGPGPSDADLSHSPTITTGETQQGVILGTAAYMSPDQARGKALDKRTDIWSFGCVLYEALTGNPAFVGATFSDTMAGILTREPDWDRLPDSMPANVRALLRRCLRKDRERRLRDIGDARLELEDALTGAPGIAGAEVAARPSTRNLVAGVFVGLVFGALAAGLVVTRLGREAAPRPPVTHFAISLPAKASLFTGVGPSVALSPDGSLLAYAAQSGGQRQIHLRRLDRLEAEPIPGTEGGVVPFFSPDGQWIGFRHLQSRTVRKVALSGGAPVTVCETEVFYGASWAPDDTIVFSPTVPGALARVPAAGGKPQPLTKLDLAKNERDHRYAQILPGGKAVLFTIGYSDIESYDDARIAVQSLETGERKILVEGGTLGRYSPSGHLLYVRAGNLLAVPFDLAKLAVTGSPVPVLKGVFESVNQGSAHFDVTRSGSLVYVPGGPEGAERTVVWVDRQGKAEPLPLPQRAYLHPRISPDAKRLAIEIEGPSHDCFLYEFERDVLTKVTLDGLSHWPLWTPKGDRLTFRKWTGAFTMWWMPADRSAPEERLTTVGFMQSPASWSPDTRVVAFTQVGQDTGPDAFVLDMSGDRKPRPIAQSKFSEGSPRFSPDGRWIVYTSAESGRNEIYGQPYPGPGPKIQISNEGGTDAVWNPRGGELFYRNGDKMMVVDLATSPTLTLSKPRVLWEGHYSLGTSSSCGGPGPTSSNYDVTPDGQRFIMIRDEDQDAVPTTVNVVLGWAEELKRLMQAKKS